MKKMTAAQQGSKNGMGLGGFLGAKQQRLLRK